MEFKSEFRRGFNSVFKFTCKMCGINLNISSENDKKIGIIDSNNSSHYLPINQALVNGSLAIGKLTYLLKFIFISNW